MLEEVAFIYAHPPFSPVVVLGLAVAGALGIPALIQGSYAVRKWLHERRIRRLEAMPNDDGFRPELGDPPPPVEIHRMAMVVLAVIIWLTAVSVVRAYELDGFWEIAISALLGFVPWLAALWRKANDPKDEDGSHSQDYGTPPDVEFPGEAIGAFLIAAALIAGIFMIWWTL